MRVALFITCLCDLFFPEVGESTLRLLRRLGVEVTFPAGQTCCGQPAYNTGYTAEARDVARNLIEVFEREAPGLPVVTPSGSCAAMIRHHYARLFAGDSEWAARAAAFAERVYELSEFIVHVLGRTDLGARYPAVATFHRSCHMARGLGLVEEPLALLRAVEGLELVDLPHPGECCGFGGTFAVKMAELSTAMVDAKVQAIEETGAQLLVGCDVGCLMHIGGRLRRLGRPVRVLHLAQLLDEATRPARRTA
ncbi:MAG: Fe-S oxidoreductase [Bacillota bacterium]|nr:MAG: Fe-S oxidoreductase [Bacillota bacterium]